MEVSGWIIGATFVFAVLVVILARWVIKRHILRGRKPINLKVMYQQNMVDMDVRYEIFERVLNIIGQSYKLDPELLRPSDELKLFYDLDSWDLGEGTETINELVIKEFGLTYFDVKPKTILELIIEIEQRNN